MADFLEEEDVLALLRKQVKKAGSQVAWSRKTGICRPNLNNILNEHRPLRGVILSALGLQIAYAKNIQAKRSAVQAFFYDGVLALLREQVSKAGGQVAWSKKTGINRSHLNLVLNRHRPLTDAVLAALEVRVVYVGDVQAVPIRPSPFKRHPARKT